jgi:hypothetical protein
VKALASAVDRGIKRTRIRESIGDAFLDTAHGSVRPLIDLADLSEKLAGVKDKSIKAAADALSAFLRPAPTSFSSNTRVTRILEGLHGLGIFAPSVTGAADLTRLELSKPRYKDLELVKYGNNRWRNWCMTI